MSLSKTTGIYLIENTVNGRCYIGASIRVGRRWREHVYSLQHGYHHNAVLLADWKLYGESAFRFELLEELNAEQPDWNLWMHRYHADGKELYNYDYVLVSSDHR